jgi:3-oxoacyl-[acyl-carrier protein] reductase
LYEELKGKRVLVTGASRGVGAATALAFAQSGARSVTIHYNSYERGALEVVRSVKQAGAEADAIQANLGTDAGIQSFVDSLRQRGPEFDVLINNAGSLVKRASLPEYTPQLFDEVMNLNAKSVYFITQAVAPFMIEQKSGFIVNLSSIAARNGGGPGATIYSAAKAAVATITKGLAKELAPKGIRVNAVSPGTVDNHFHEQFSTRQMLENMVNMTPAGRLGDNEEVADTILFLCSNGARYIYGQTLEINGGMYMV